MVLRVGLGGVQRVNGANSASIPPTSLDAQLDQPEPAARVATAAALIPAPLMAPHLPSAGVAGLFVFARANAGARNWS